MNNSLNAKTTLNIDGKSYNYFSLSSASEFLGIDVTKLPCSLKVLLENLLRNEDGVNVKLDDIKILASCVNKHANHEISYKPARVLMQDFTGVPVVVDLASMRKGIGFFKKERWLVSSERILMLSRCLRNNKLHINAADNAGSLKIKIREMWKDE